MNPLYNEQDVRPWRSSLETPKNAWGTLPSARIAASHWLRSDARLYDGEIAKVMSMNATDVFLLRTRSNRDLPADATDVRSPDSAAARAQSPLR